ncbi:hypothetical protein DIPPA_03750 [Diplonema papillatum]|nr:hypothetical protein DIPPA_03750 [Diplonema papillatum]
MALSASLAEPPPPQHQLYSLEVYCHGLRDLEGVATSTNPCLAFRLWDFPTLFIRPDLQNKEGHRRGTEAKDGCFRSICFESGRSCLFQVRPAELACRLPLMLHVLLLDEESETERTVLGSHALVIGEENDSLRCSISRGVFSLADVLGRKVGAMTIDVRLTCLGDSNIPRKLTQSAPAGGALLPGQHSPIGAVVGGGGLQARMMHAASTSNDWHRVNRLLGPPPAAAGGRPVVGGFDDNYPSSSIAGVPSFFRQSSKSHTSKRGRKRPKGSSSRHRNYDEDASVTYSDDLMAPVKSQSGVAKRFQYESMRKYLRYEVLAQLATITALVEEYVASDRRLGRLQEYALDEQDFLLQEVGLIKNLSHNTNKVLSAVDQYCHAQHGVSALGVPAPSRSYTPGRRTRSRDRAAAAAHHHHRRRPSADGSESSSSGAQRSRSGKRAHPTGKTRRRSRSDDETREKREKRDDLDSKKHDASSDAKEKAALAQAQEDKRQAAEGAESERARQKDKEELDRLQAALDKKKLALEDGIKEKEAGEARRLQGEAEKAVADAKQAQLKAELALQEAQNQEAKLQAQKAAPADREEAVHDEFEDADKAAAANQQSKAKAQAESDSEAKLKAQAEAAAKQQPGEAKEKAPAWKVGQRARVRDTEKESWKKGTVTKLDGDRPLVRVDGQDPAFHWNFVEAVEDDMPAFTAGERVKVRDTAKEEWKRGVVTTVAGGKVSVRLEGQQRAFTWNFVAADKPQFKPGDRVRARDKAADPWAAGTVESADSTNTTVRLDGAKQAFTWAHVEPLPKDEEPELKKEPTGVAKEDFSIGDRVRVRDTEHEEWRKGVVTSKANGVTSVLVEGLQKEFSWNLIERDAAAAAVAAPAGHAVGDRVRVRDTAKEDWRAGTVANATGANVTVKLDGQDRAFTWNHVEKDAPPSKQQYSVGDRVRVRDTAKQDWRSGTVATVTADNVTVRLDGQDRPFTWSFVEPLPTSPSAKGKTKVSSPTAKQKAALSVGARVRVRDTEVEVWHKGAVESITNGRPVVKVDGQKKAFTWNFVEPLPDEKPTSDTSAKDQFAVGERVKVRDTAKQDWTRGTVESVASGRVTVRPDGQQRAFTWTFVEKDAHVEGGSPPGPAGFRVGDKVKVRDSEKQPWNKGVVEKVSGAKPVVRVNGQPRAFTWMFCERDDDAAAAGAAFAKGDRVRVRDRPNDLWRNGIALFS